MISIPLRKACLCVDCENIFEMGGGLCVVCGSQMWIPLGRTLNPIIMPEKAITQNKENKGETQCY